MSDVSKRIANLSPEKLAQLRRAAAKTKGDARPAAAPDRITARPADGEPTPLSFGQERLWVIDQLAPNNPSYNVPALVPLHGPLDAALLERAIAAIATRHDILRTTFPVRDGRPVQLVAPVDAVAIPLHVVDLSQTAGGEADAQREIAAELARPFDLARGPLLRTSLFQLVPRDGQPRHLLLLVMHHIVSDAWSGDVFLRELTTLYQAFAAGRPSPLPPLPIQYADFARWQRESLTGPRLDRLLAHWKTVLDGAPRVLALPTDRPRSPTPGQRGAIYSFAIAPELRQALRALCERTQATMFMTTLAVFQVLLGRYAGVDDVVVGVPIANRSRAELEGLIGFFLNTLALRTQLSGDPTFVQLVEQVRQTTLDAYAHQDLPFDTLVEALRPDRSLAIHPIFQVMFVMQAGHPSRGAVDTEHGAVDVGAVAVGSSRFDLSLSLIEHGDQLSGIVEYSTELYDAPTIERMVGHYRALLAEVTRAPDARLSTLSMLTPAEHDQIRSWHDTAVAWDSVALIHHLLEHQARERPDAVAARFEGQEIRYRELDERANQLAHRLRALGVGPETLVGLFVERSFEMLVAVFGVLKAGGAYVPLDPNYPPDRVEFMLADTASPVLLTQRHLAARLRSYAGTVVQLDADWPAIAAEPRVPPRVAISPDHPAYVIYTSGSTGKPKGLVVPHRGVCNLAEVEIRLYRTHPGDRVLQFASLNFDASVYEMLMWLRGGAQLQLARTDVIRSGADLMDLVAREGVTLMPMPPSVLASLPVVPAPALRMILVMGEEVPPELVARWRHVPEFFNAYGPTETSVWTAGKFLRPDETVTIGRPVGNTRLYLLDGQLRPVPVGVPGEIYIAGVGVTRGYFRRPGTTAAHFLPDVFSPEPGRRMYRAGDLAVYQPSGEIRFLGRRDFQVKLRGFRIELGEIESALAQLPRIKDVMVMVRDDLPGGRGLVAYVVADPPAPGIAELRRALGDKLPAYMVPSAFVVLGAFPLTPAGKLDRAALPLPFADRGDAAPGLAAGVALGNMLEQTIAGIWAAMLGLPRVGPGDNFFELGGHSLLAAQIVARLRETFQVDVSIRHVFEFPTVAGLATVIEDALRKAGRPLAPATPAGAGAATAGDAGLDALLRGRIDELLAVLSIDEKQALAARLGAAPLAFAQERLWFLRQLHPDDVSYNIPATIPLEDVDPARLSAALDQIVHRHDILRTTFRAQAGARAGRAVQLVAPALDLPLAEVDLRDLDDAGRGAALQKIFTAEVAHRFDLATGPLLRATLIRLTERHACLLLLIDHIIADEWSIGVLTGELHALYQGVALAPLGLQYADYARRQRAALEGPGLDAQIDYWKRTLRDAPPLIALPLDRPRAAGPGAGALHSVILAEPVADQLRGLAQREQTTLFTVAVAGFAAFLSRTTGQHTLVIGSPVTSRSSPELERLIGLFVNMLALRVDVADGASFTGLIRQLRATLLEALVHQDVPFARLVEELQPARDPAINPLFQVAITLHNPTTAAARRAGGDGSPHLAAGTAKFDLSIHLQEVGREIEAGFEYKPALFDASTIAGLAERFRVLVAQLAEHPDAAVVDARPVDPASRPTPEHGPVASDAG